MGQQNHFPSNPRERCAGCGNVLSLCACRGVNNVSQNRSTPSADFSSTAITGQQPAHLNSYANLQNYEPTVVGMPEGHHSSVVGSIISERYELVAKLGSGGMGVVYKARHLALNKLFAIKIVSDHLASQDEFRLRFDREAKSASMLDHPNLVSITDYGMTEINEPYIVMDFINGWSLAEELVQYQRLPIERAVRIFQQICDGVGYAHGVGLVHRDLKPGNIMLSRAGESNEQVKIIDFGIAKLLSGQRDVTQSHTRTNAMGSPLYMSPEQCSGQKADRRSDIYSMGCLMYECLISTPPFQGGSVLATMSMHMNDTPQSLERYQVPRALEAAVMRCLAKNPSERFQTMDELKAALAHCLTENPSVQGAHSKSGMSQNQPINATTKNNVLDDFSFSKDRDLRRNVRPKQFSNRSPAVIATVILVVVGVAALGVGVFKHLLNHQRNAGSSERESVEKRDAPHESTPSNQSSTEKADASATPTPNLSEEQKQKLLQEQFATIGPTPPVTDIDQNQPLEKLVETCKKLLENHQEEKALAYFKLAAFKNPDRVEPYEAVLDYFWNRRDQDKVALRKCINIATAYLIYHPNDYYKLRDRGQYYVDSHDYPSAIADYTRALSSAVTPEQKVQIHLKLAFVHKEMHDLDAAIADYKGNVTVRDLNSLCLFADCYAEKRDYENAVKVATEALTTTSKHIPDPLQLKSTLYWARTIRGGALRNLGDYAKAKEDYEAALKLAFSPEQRLRCKKDVEECTR
jgi:serine/threonine protein kinase